MITPDVTEEFAPRNNFFPPYVEVPQYACFLFGQANLDVQFAVDERPSAWPKLVPTYHERSGMVSLVLTQVSSQSGEQDCESERPGHVVVGTIIKAENGFHVRWGWCSQNDRNSNAAAAQKFAKLVSVHVRELQIQENCIKGLTYGEIERFVAASRLRNRELTSHPKVVGQ